MFLLFAMIVQDPHAQVEGSMKAQLVREIRRFPLLIVESRTGREYLSSITEITNGVPCFSLFRRKKLIKSDKIVIQEMIKKKKGWTQLKQWLYENGSQFYQPWYEGMILTYRSTRSQGPGTWHRPGINSIDPSSIFVLKPKLECILHHIDKWSILLTRNIKIKFPHDQSFQARVLRSCHSKSCSLLAKVIFSTSRYWNVIWWYNKIN